MPELETILTNLIKTAIAVFDRQAARAGQLFRINRTRILSILFVEVTGVSAILLYLLLLPDSALVLVLATLAFTGLISGSVASNNTAKIYASIASSEDRAAHSVLTLHLFCFEQVLAVLIAFFFMSQQLDTLQGINPLLLVLLAVFSSNTAIIAYTRYRHRHFILYNCLRGIMNLLRVLLVFAAASHMLHELIPDVIAVSMAVLYCTGLVILRQGLRESGSNAGQTRPMPSILLLLREYLLGLPAAAARSFITNGLMIAVVETLSESSARLFRFLMLLKDICGRIFNAVLPLVFDHVFRYRIKTATLLFVFTASLPISIGWFSIGATIFNVGWAGWAIYAVLFGSNMLVYVVMPFVWRAIHRNRALLSTTVVLVATAAAIGAYVRTSPSDVASFLMVMSVFYVTWLSLMLVLSWFDELHRPSTS